MEFLHTKEKILDGMLKLIWEVGLEKSSIALLSQKIKISPSNIYYYYKGKDPVLLMFTTMPFGMNALEQYAWFYFGGGMEIMQKSYEKHGMYSFHGGNTGVQMGGWFRKEINSLEDLKGLKMRIPGFAGEIFAKLGCAVTNIISFIY